MGTTALVGRSTELSMLQTFCRRADPSGGSLLLIGEPGVGKTALLDAITDWAGAEGFYVLRAQAVRAEVGTQYSTLNQLLLPLEGWMPRLEADDQQALSEALGFVEGSGHDISAVAQAASSLLRLVAADQPVLLVLDDVHWADRASAEALARLTCRLDGSRTGLLGAARSHDTGFFDSRLLSCAQVTPLDPVAASELITQRFPGLDRGELPGLLARGGGNPLTLLELAAGPVRGQRGLGYRRVTMLPLSRRVRQAFAEDIRALPAETARLLLLLALEGTGDLTLWDAPPRPPELRPAEQVGLVSVDVATRRLTFSHPLIPLTVIGLATSDDRRRAHQELSQKLAPWPTRQAPHLAEATTATDEGVARQLDSAALAIARAGDAAASVTISLRAAALSEDLTAKARRHVDAACLSATATGEISGSLDLLQEATRSDPTVVSTLRYAMALAAATLHGRGDADRAYCALISALGAQLDQDDVDRATLVEAAQLLLDLCRWTQRPEHWSSLDAILTELGSGTGPLLRLQVATLVDPLRAPVAALDQFEAERQELPTDLSDTSLVRVAECAIQAGRFAPYRDRLEAVVAGGRERAGTATAIDALCCLAQDAVTTGDWDRARLLVDEGLAWCDRLGHPLRGWTLQWVRVLVDAGRGDLLVVRQTTDEMLQWAEQHGIRRVRDYAHHARALAALSSGEFELAYREATAIVAAGSRPPRGSGTLDPALCVVEAAMHTYRPDEAARLARALCTDHLGMLSPRSRLLVAAATAIAAPEPDRATLFEHALAQPGSADCPFDLARVHLAYGEQLRRSRATSMARPHLRAALSIFERLDASLWVERTRIELDASGESRNQVEPGLALTPQERTIALLAASGHSNKQIAEKLFLTHRTVAAHLHQVFPKLGVDSRAALRDAFDSRDAAESHPRRPLHHAPVLSQKLIDRDAERGRAPGDRNSASLPP